MNVMKCHYLMTQWYSLFGKLNTKYITILLPYVRNIESLIR
jgi:hypothetical protein